MLSEDMRGLADRVRQVCPDLLAHGGFFRGLLLNLDAMTDQAEQLERAGTPAPAAPIAIPMTPDWMHQVRAVRA